VLVEPGADVYGWLSALWHLTSAVHVTVMVFSEPPEFFTWTPYRSEECGNVTTIMKLNITQLFFYKVKPPLNNCPFYAVTTPLPPFVNSDGTGIETRMYHTMAEKMKLQSDYVQLPPNERVWSTLDTAGHPFNGMKLLYENKVDVMFSSLRVCMSVAPYTEFLASHTLDVFSLFVPSPKPVPRVSAMYRAFPPAFWSLGTTASLVILTAAAAIPRIETGKWYSPFLSSTAIILNTSTNFPPSKAFSVFAIIAYMYSLHITTAYQSSFIVFLSDVVREKPIKNVEDIANSDLKVQFFETEYKSIQDLANISKHYAALVKPNRGFFVNILHLVYVSANKFSLLGPKIAFQYQIRPRFFYDDNGYPKILILKDELFPAEISIFISRGHPLQPFLHQYSRRLVEGGMPIYYLREQMKHDIIPMRYREPFNIGTVEGPFLLHVGLLTISFIVWLVEMIYFHALRNQSKTKTIRNSWKRK